MSTVKVSNALDPFKVLLFVPNIIGYVRLLLLGAAAVSAASGASGCFFPFYTASQLLDLADGYAARRLKQVSVFGACLDQLLDRLSTCLLYVLNAVAYPTYSGAFFWLLLADVGGHWLHFFASTAAGAASHKKVDEAPLLLQYYYTVKGFMALCIVCYEGILLSFLAAHASVPGSFIHNAATICAVACVPLAAFKTLTNVLQGYYGALRLASLPVPSASD